MTKRVEKRANILLKILKEWFGLVQEEKIAECTEIQAGSVKETLEINNAAEFFNIRVSEDAFRVRFFAKFEKETFRATKTFKIGKKDQKLFDEVDEIGLKNAPASIHKVIAFLVNARLEYKFAQGRRNLTVQRLDLRGIIFDN